MFFEYFVNNLYIFGEMIGGLGIVKKEFLIYFKGI